MKEKLINIIILYYKIFGKFPDHKYFLLDIRKKLPDDDDIYNILLEITKYYVEENKNLMYNVKLCIKEIRKRKINEILNDTKINNI